MSAGEFKYLVESLDLVLNTFDDVKALELGTESCRSLFSEGVA